MYEIRPISKKEVPDFLDLLVKAFNLNAHIAKKLFLKDPLFDLKRKWALFHDKELLSILTTVPLKFGIGRAIGIAGVATHSKAQGMGYATTLIKEVLLHSKNKGEERALLFAQDPRLYIKVGFTLLDQVIQGTIQPLPNQMQFASINKALLREHYNKWSCANPFRLQRDERRWKYWDFFGKPCLEYGSGYICRENNIVREAIVENPLSGLPVPKETLWIGLQSLTEELKIPLTHFKTDSYFLGVGFPECPKMFMTDQF